MSNIVRIDPNKYGLTVEKANSILAAFSPHEKAMEELKPEFNEIEQMDMSPERCEKAKKLRNKYVKIRGGVEIKRKEFKEFYLKGGNYVDGVGNAYKSASSIIEDTLKDIENYYINIEKEKIAKIEIERKEELEKYGQEVFPNGLGEMDSEIYDKYLGGVKRTWEIQKAEEEKAEKEKLEYERKEKLFTERRIEIAQYSQFDIVKTLTIDTTDDAYKEIIGEAKKLYEDFQREQARIQAENLRLKKEQEEKDKAAEKLRKENERKLDAERAEKERVAAELKAKEDEAARVAAEAEERKQADLEKGDSDKLNDLIRDINELNVKYNFEAKDYKELYSNVSKKLSEVVGYIKDNM